ncbi:DegV family protein [Heyndrickxia ginsengihumi]|uniref:DegV family protein n=1 Tax=Heyndrickxia ginsengihumi TaxID=363870 RepID=UPI00203B9A5A|nr:DegV family protein [Heyndrickxia ginsengihumi]MCM3023581.1 DegV family protein [Heyndrickxia ginsengihumi]
MNVQLFADSGCDLPLHFYKDNDIHLIPLTVYVEEKAYDDLIEINPKELFTFIRNGVETKTSQPSPDVFEKMFTNLATANQPGIYMAFSSELSGTYQTAVMIRNQVKETYPNLDLTIIDTKCASIGYGLVVKAAADLLKRGASKEEVIKDIELRSQHMEHIFTVEDLDFLARGGRLSKASAFLGGLLNIKPVLNVEEGKLIPLEKLRGRKKLFKRILDIMDERGVDLEHQLIGICHGDDEQSAEELKQLIQDRFGTKEFLINTIGSVIGSHAGPGTLAVFFLNEVNNA